MKTILILKETREGETRVAATPTTVAALRELGYNLLLQSRAGEMSGFSDWEYHLRGATIVSDHPRECIGADLVLLVKRPRADIETAIVDYLSPHATILGFLDPQIPQRHHLLKYRANRLTTFTWEFLPESFITDSFDAISPMSQISGIAVVREFMESAGIQDLQGKRVLVLGLGNVGLAATKEAAKLGADVTGLSTSRKAESSLSQWGCRFMQMPKGSLGAQQTLVKSLLLDYSAPFDLVVCAARRRGKPAPLLITPNVLKKLPQTLEIHDLTASSGGNCAGNQFSKTVTIGKAKVCNITGYPKRYPKLSTPPYANCVLRFVSHLLDTSGASEQELGYCLQSCLTTSGLITPMLPEGDDDTNFLAQSRQWHKQFLMGRQLCQN